MAGFNGRAALGLAGAGLLGAVRPSRAETITPPFGNGERPLVRYPEKREPILFTSRPPQLETPFAAYGEGLLTPNDAFFVRYHLADLPTDTIDPVAFRLEVKGQVANALSLDVPKIVEYLVRTYGK